MAAADIPIRLGPMLSAEGPFCWFIHVASWDRDRRRPLWALTQRRNTYWLLVNSFDDDEQIRVENQRHPVASGRSYLCQPGRLADIGSTGGNSRPGSTSICGGIPSGPSRLTPRA